MKKGLLDIIWEFRYGYRDIKVTKLEVIIAVVLLIIIVCLSEYRETLRERLHGRINPKFKNEKVFE